MKFHQFHTYPSTYLAIVVWGCSAFMAQPTFASLVVHIILIGMLGILLWLAHWEGRNTASQSFIDS